MTYIVITILFFACLLAYFRIADYFDIIDRPNERSSHHTITIRGGGVIFPLAVIVGFILGYASLPLTLAVFLVALVSFVDDVRPLSQLPRFGVHLLASILICYGVGLGEYSLWWGALAVFLLIGWVNIFNFMDGINGITALYALVGIFSFSLLPFHQDMLDLLIIVGLSCVVFGFFNIRTKARAFAGDVGSVSMAMFLGYLMIKTILITENSFYLLFFSVYGIDACFTILFRLLRKENIFLPHRTHLYQYLANELKINHVLVSSVYAVVQLAINLILIYSIDMDQVGYGGIAVFVGVCCVIYLVLRSQVLRRVQPSS